VILTHHSSFCRDIDLTEKLDYSSAVALLGYSLILSLLRTFNVKDEATRVMFAAPILAFVTTHILYLNFYELDYGKVPFPIVEAFYLLPSSNENNPALEQISSSNENNPALEQIFF
jgi:hypothetical protein